MIRRGILRIAVLLAALLVGGALGASATLARATDGWIYTESDVAGPNANSVLAVHSDRDGSTRPLDVREFPTHGSGEQFVRGSSVGVFAGDQQVALSKDGSFLFAVNEGSNTVAVFKVDKDNGSLKAVAGSPFPSGGDAPISVGFAGKFLVVANHGLHQGQSPPGQGVANYVSFSISKKGRLSRVSTVPAMFQAPTQALIAPSGKLMFGADFFSNNIDSLQIGSHGSLTAAPGSPQQFPDSVSQDRSAPPGLPPQAVKLPFGIAAHPTKNFVYYLAAVSGRLATYSYDATGKLTFVSQVDNNGAIAACWARVTPNGRFLYTLNSASLNITLFSLADPAHPAQVQVFPVREGTAFNLEIAPSGRTLYALVAHDDPDFPRPQPGDGNFLAAFRIGGNGALTELAPTPLPVPFSAFPVGLAVVQHSAGEKKHK